MRTFRSKATGSGGMSPYTVVILVLKLGLEASLENHTHNKTTVSDTHTHSMVENDISLTIGILASGIITEKLWFM